MEPGHRWQIIMEQVVVAEALVAQGLVPLIILEPLAAIQRFKVKVNHHVWVALAREVPQMEMVIVLNTVGAEVVAAKSVPQMLMMEAVPYLEQVREAEVAQQTTLAVMVESGVLITQEERTIRARLVPMGMLAPPVTLVVEMGAAGQVARTVVQQLAEQAVLLEAEAVAEAALTPQTKAQVEQEPEAR